MIFWDVRHPCNGARHPKTSLKNSQFTLSDSPGLPPVLHVEAGTALHRVFVVAVDVPADGIGGFQLSDEGGQRGFLCRGHGVLVVHALCGHAADEGDADAAGVMSEAVRTCEREGPALVHPSVGMDDVVVADTLPTSLAVPGVNLGCAGGLVGCDCRTVNDDEGDGSHGRDSPQRSL